MDQFITDITAVSSKGQIVLPKKIRDHLCITAGTKMMVISDNENIILKPIRIPDISEFKDLMETVASPAEGSGMTARNVEESIPAFMNKQTDAL